jgi:hypothetical protein
MTRRSLFSLLLGAIVGRKIPAKPAPDPMLDRLARGEWVVEAQVIQISLDDDQMALRISRDPAFHRGLMKILSRRSRRIDGADPPTIHE